jgi:opacity protein-like surface antigen
LKKLSFLTYLFISSSAVAEFNIGMLAGLNIINGNVESFRTDIPYTRYYKSNYNIRNFSPGICAGYDYFFRSLTVGIDAQWLNNKNKWKEIAKVAGSMLGMDDTHEKISTRHKLQYSAGIRIGYLSGRFLPYLRLGIEKFKFNTRLLSFDDIRGSSSYQWSHKQCSSSIGAGFEYKTYDNLWLRIEGRYINPKPFHLYYRSITYDRPATLKISSQRILLTAGIIYRF